MTKSNKIVLFPGLKKTLEKIKAESDQAIRDQQFEVALEKINYLLSHHFSSFEMYIHKINCLMKLNRYKEAEYCIESLLENKTDAHYFEYVEYYVMVLFEANEYSRIMKFIDEEEKTKPIPSRYLDTFKRVYAICYEMNKQQASEVSLQLENTIHTDDDEQQYRLFHEWEKLYVAPLPIFKEMVQLKTVHPVLKTKILEVLQTSGIDDKVTIKKWNQTMVIEASKLPALKQHPNYIALLNELRWIEQNNPSLFHLILELVDHYHYVHFPFFYPIDEVEYVAKAFSVVGQMHLSLLSEGEKMSERVQFYMEEIEKSNELYFKLML